MRMSRRIAAGGSRVLLLFDIARGGDQTAKSGGWTKRENVSGGLPVTVGESGIRVYANWGCQGTYLANSPIDPARYTKLCAEVSAAENMTGQLLIAANTQTAGTQGLARTVIRGPGSYEVDLTGLAGPLWVGLRGVSPSNGTRANFTVTKLWLA